MMQSFRHHRDVARIYIRASRLYDSAMQEVGLAIKKGFANEISTHIIDCDQMYEYGIDIQHMTSLNVKLRWTTMTLK